MQPLLTTRNAQLEEDTYSWWLVRAGAGRGLGVSGGPGTWVHTRGPSGRFVRITVLVIHSFIQKLLTGDLLCMNRSRAFCKDTLVLSISQCWGAQGPFLVETSKRVPAGELGCSHFPRVVRNVVPTPAAAAP